MIYLTRHETQAAYDAVKNNLDKPQVAYIVETDGVEYQPYVSPYVGHEYVDLGLPSGTKWATMNVGANSVNDYGYYYQYGKGSSQYAATSGQSSYTSTENPLAITADTAAQAWGGEWHMPTKNQFEELTANTTLQWTTLDGVYGSKFTAQNGNYVFLPAGGSYWQGELLDDGQYCIYWSSTPNDTISSYYLYVGSQSENVYDGNRSSGNNVRPVVG